MTENKNRLWCKDLRGDFSTARRPMICGQLEPGKFKRRRNNAADQCPAFVRRSRLPVTRRNKMLRIFSAYNIGPQPHLGHRSFIPGRGAERQRTARMPKPQLRRVNPVPVRALPGLEQKIDRRRAGPLAIRRLGAPGLAVPAALGMRQQAEPVDDGLCFGHARTGTSRLRATLATFATSPSACRCHAALVPFGQSAPDRAAIVSITSANQAA